MVTVREHKKRVILKKTKQVNLINRPIETLAIFIQYGIPGSLRALRLEFYEIYKIEIMFSLKSGRGS